MTALSLCYVNFSSVEIELETILGDKINYMAAHGLVRYKIGSFGFLRT